MDVYHVMLRKPFNSSVWNGLGGGTVNCSESSGHRRKRVGVGDRLESLTGDKPEWNQTAYEYTAILTEDQVKEILTWYMVRSVDRHLR